jgi:hypothetical protein
VSGDHRDDRGQRDLTPIASPRYVRTG